MVRWSFKSHQTTRKLRQTANPYLCQQIDTFQTFLRGWHVNPSTPWKNWQLEPGKSPVSKKKIIFQNFKTWDSKCSFFKGCTQERRNLLLKKLSKDIWETPLLQELGLIQRCHCKRESSVPMRTPCSVTFPPQNDHGNKLVSPMTT